MSAANRELTFSQRAAVGPMRPPLSPWRRRFVALVIGLGWCAVLECFFGYWIALRESPADADLILKIGSALFIVVVGLLTGGFRWSGRRLSR